jgi:hypothetical protein
MSEFLDFENNPWVLPLIGLFVLLLAWLLYRIFSRKFGGFEGAIAEISFDRFEELVIPNADDGEILIDHLLLTSQGLLVLEVKDVQGAVFGGDKMQDWAVITDGRRYTFSNPQPALYDRIAAVREIVRQVPVAGRILFLDGAEFTKGVPKLVCNLTELIDAFGEPDKSAANFKIEAFKPHWEAIRKQALSFSQK